MLKHLYFIIVLLSVCSCSNKKPDFSKQKIQFGLSVIKGEIFNYPALLDSNVIMSKSNTVFSEFDKYSTRISKDGTFSFNIPVECNQYASLVICDSVFGIFLIPNREIKVSMEFSDGKMHINKNDLILSISETNRLWSRHDGLGHNGKMERMPLKPVGEHCLDDYSNAVTECLNNLQKQVDAISDISGISKIFIYNTIKMTDLSIFMEPDILQYWSRNYWKDTNPPKLDISFYKFLKAYDLNDPDCLYGCYCYVLQQILSNDFFDIPPIEDTDIELWMVEVRKKMADLVGFDKGLFYDMLAANAYSKQLNDKLQPLSEKQKENIQKYFKDKYFVELLLDKNEEIKPFAGTSSSLKVNEMPSVPGDRLSEGQLLDAIVSEYRGKVVVVDLWATWCQPCMKAMQEMRPLKKELADRGAVFVYLTNTSSPQSPWKEKIPGIGGEHYYLNGDEWKSISDSEKYGFQYIPTYFIFDVEGNLKSKLSSYPGNDEMKKLIDNLL